jgi:2-isopropylmalate synthase
MAEDRVRIFDTTLRDGEQAAGASMTGDEKLEIAKQLEKLGVDVIEAGFAASSPGDMESIKRIAKEIKNSTVCSLARANPDDIDAAWESIKEAVHPRIHTFISSSDIHMEHQLRKNREEVIDMAVSAVSRAKGYCEDVEFSPMDATRTDPDFLYALVQAAIDAGATTINIPDTVGYAVPEEFGALIASIIENVPNIDKAIISVHCHNDLGQAVANSLAAVKAGARQVEGCINGIGERAGNTALEEVIMALHTRHQYFDTTVGIDTTQIYPTSRMVSEITNFPVQPNKAIVGTNSFRHASGIHQDGIIKERTTYEIMDPKDVGWVGETMVLSKLSGRAGLRSRMEELGYTLDRDELNRVFLSFKELADKKREVTDRDLEALMAEDRRVEEVTGYHVESVAILTGTGLVPTATVVMITPDGEKRTEQMEGNGPVDAVCNAVVHIVGVQPKLDEYSVRSITEGLDAVGDVTVRLRYGNRIYTGRAADTDILVASAKAYTNAMNRLLALDGTEIQGEMQGV